MRSTASDEVAAEAGSRLEVYEITPDATDPAIDNWTDAHLIAIDPGARPRNKLFLFLAGSYGIPARQSLITRLAARMGYHAVNLCYPNAWTVGGLCRSSEDNDCHGQVRLQIFDGVPRTDLVRFAPANAIDNRLIKLLAHLDSRFPEQGWSRYLNGKGVDWSSVVVAGHSQGGGQAAIIGKVQAVERVIMLASPVDHGRGDMGPAAWLSRAGATPPERFFGFVHRHDQGFDHIQVAWRALGMVPRGQLVSVENSAPPYLRSQRLVTDLEDVRQGKYHSCVVQDRITPLHPDGKPVFEPVWRYLLGG
jgi:hypothetical protein